MVIDIGTGDGRSVLRRATAEPGSLCIGVDADAAAMAEASRRADRQRLSDALFLAAGAETLAGSPLRGTADLVTVTFPWGSLLRGVLGLAPATLEGIAAVLARDGELVVLTSVAPADGIDGITTLTAADEPAIAAAWAAAGLCLDTMCPATPDQVTASGSTWARRLLARGRGRTATERTVWRLAGGLASAPSVPWAATSAVAVRPSTE